MRKLIHILRYNLDEQYKKSYDRKMYKAKFTAATRAIYEGVK